MRSLKIRNTRIILGLFVVLISLTFIGCTSSRKEELDRKLEQGEELLKEEKYEEAHKHYKDLLEGFQDNLTVMEKIEYAQDMKESREDLNQAKEAIEEKEFQDAVMHLKNIPEFDQKAIEEKARLLVTIQEDYVERANEFVALESYDSAIELLQEYQMILGEDPKISEKIEMIIQEKEKPVEIIKKIIIIDPAHQANANLEEEPIAPGSNVTRSKVTKGAVGIQSTVPEYVLNLELAKEMKNTLIDAGYEVYLTRETHDVNLSNQERSSFANDKNADIFIRLHGNSNNDTEKQGIQIYYPSIENNHVGTVSTRSEKAAHHILDELVKSTSAVNQGLIAADNMPEHNFSKSPVMTLLVGYMTNEEEDVLLQSSVYQKKIAEGLKNGINLYFESIEGE